MNPSILITRPLYRNEAERLSAEIRNTPNILGYRPNELLAFSESLVVEVNRKCAGICLIKHLIPGWSEIAIIFVFPEYRRQGIGATLFRTAFAQLQEKGVKILCMSREPSILRLMEAHGMQYISNRRLPFAIHWLKQIHYSSPYRTIEMFRKIPMYRNQPPFRQALWSP